MQTQKRLAVTPVPLKRNGDVPCACKTQESSFWNRRALLSFWTNNAPALVVNKDKNLDHLMTGRSGDVQPHRLTNINLCAPVSRP